MRAKKINRGVICTGEGENMRASLVLSLVLAASCVGPDGMSGGGGGGAGTGGGSGGGGVSGTPITKRGEIDLTEYCSTGLCAAYTGVSFAPPSTTGCSVTALGDCTAFSCSLSGFHPVSDNAGTVSIAGTDAGVIELTFSDGGKYSQFMTSNLVWGGGETLTVSAAGATVPAFSKSITAPGSNITVTSPACSAHNCGTVDRAADLSIAWTGDATTGVTVGLNSLKGGGYTLVSCNFSASPGTIPAAMVGLMGKSSDGYDNSILIKPANSTTFSAGDYSITFTAIYDQGTSGKVTTLH